MHLLGLTGRAQFPLHIALLGIICWWKLKTVTYRHGHMPLPLRQEDVEFHPCLLHDDLWAPVPLVEVYLPLTHSLYYPHRTSWQEHFFLPVHNLFSQIFHCSDGSPPDLVIPTQMSVTLPQKQVVQVQIYSDLVLVTLTLYTCNCQVSAFPNWVEK